MEKEYTVTTIKFNGLTYKLPHEIKLTDREINLGDNTILIVLLKLLGVEVLEEN